MKHILIQWLLLMTLSGPALAACGGSFPAFVEALKQEAVGQGHDPAKVEAFFRTTGQDPKVLQADRAQGVFQRPFIDFSRRLISRDRLNKGISNGRRYDAIFQRVEQEYGVPRGLLLALWAFETDYGAFQGDFNTRNALVTLAHDCRRPTLFRPHVFAALTLFEAGDFDPEKTTGAWAGEVGMVQMLPRDILEHGVDGDGDGHVRLKSSVADALMSGGKLLSHLGWQADQPWLQEVTVPAQMDWSMTGLPTQMPAAEWARRGVVPRSGAWQDATLPASLLLPQGHKGPAFLAYPNFRVLFEWNQSFVYVMTAAYFATRLEGAPIYQAGQPDPGLDGAAMKQLQARLQARGHDVGEIDGILGARTREAVRREQARLGLPADGWPTPGLLSRL